MWARTLGRRPPYEAGARRRRSTTPTCWCWPARSTTPRGLRRRPPRPARRRRPLVVIDDLFIEPEARAVGVGEAMLGAIVEWGTGSGSGRDRRLVLPGDREPRTSSSPSGSRPGPSWCTGTSGEHAAPSCSVGGGRRARRLACCWCAGATGPRPGEWSVPGGRVERGETARRGRRARGAGGDRPRVRLRRAARLGRDHRRRPRRHRASLRGPRLRGHGARARRAGGRRRRRRGAVGARSPTCSSSTSSTGWPSSSTSTASSTPSPERPTPSGARRGEARRRRAP